MKVPRSEGLKLALLIGLPLLAAAAAMLWTTSRMLTGISDSVNAQEHDRTWDAVKSAFEAEQNHLAGVLADNARWDEAVIQTQSAYSAKWVKDMWGTTATDINYDTAFVVGPDGKTLAGFHKGETLIEDGQEFAGPLFGRLIATMPRNTSSFVTSTSMASVSGQLMALAAAPIVPHTVGFKNPAQRPNILVFGKVITPPRLALIGQQYIVDDLAVWMEFDSMAAGNFLADRWGNPIAKVTWRDRLPGDMARKTYAFSAFATLLGLIAVMLPLAAVHIRAMRKLARNRREAEHAARHDSLSELPNRLMFGDELVQLFDQDPRPPIALLYVDLDGFKSVNDNYDHETGDALIRAVAKGFAMLAGDAAMVARLGGDEFAFMVSGEGARQKAEALAVHVLAFVKEPFDLGGRVAGIGASIGLAEADESITDANELMRRADVAMYDAKARGRNQKRWFDASLDRARNDELEIAREMRSLISLGDFEVAYQPIVDSSTHRILAVEALARWPRSSARRLTPDRFIPIAEEHGLIDELGNLILARACRDLAQWQDIRLSINVSPVQLNNRSYTRVVEKIVAQNGFAMDRLEVEFTETVLIRNTERAREAIGELHGLGVTVALDDFGTGFASVGYLRTFHFDKIKLDKSLTRSIMTNVAAQKVVQGTVLIADGLAAEIIAEGIETEEEAQLLRLSGCHQLQGFYFGRPKPATELHTFLPHEAEEPLRATA